MSVMPVTASAVYLSKVAHNNFSLRFHGVLDFFSLGVLHQTSRLLGFVRRQSCTLFNCFLYTRQVYGYAWMHYGLSDRRPGKGRSFFVYSVLYTVSV